MNTSRGIASTGNPPACLSRRVTLKRDLDVQIGAESGPVLRANYLGAAPRVSSLASVHRNGSPAASTDTSALSKNQAIQSPARQSGFICPTGGREVGIV